MRGSLSRRAFLCILGALGPLQGLVAAGRGGRVGDDAISLAEFVALSERLTGHRPLDPRTARMYLDALLEVPANRELAADLAHRKAGAAVASRAHMALEERIIASWYTGVHEAGGADRVADYAGALMWTALNRPAFGFCAGETGSWSRAPGS